MPASIETFVADVVRRAKDVENLVAALPSKDDSGARVSALLCHSQIDWIADTQAARLEELQSEMLIANAEYKEALAQAGTFL